jgi:hypothetical protein
MISIVLVEHLKENIWVKEFNFYHIDLSSIDFSTDYRFKIVDEKRKLSLLLGTINELKFPVTYPIVLNNNTIINKEILK